jgi:hypothetical protein
MVSTPANGQGLDVGRSGPPPVTGAPTSGGVVVVVAPRAGVVVVVVAGGFALGAVFFGVVVFVAFGFVVVVVDALSVVVVVTDVVEVVVAETALHVGDVMVLSSRVTAPLRASARPLSVAPVCMVIEDKARMLPTNAVVVPIVAELPTCQ